jgi:hypothetical protein
MDYEFACPKGASQWRYQLQLSFIFQQAGGGMMGLALLSGGLLRVTDDLKVWRYIQAATLFVDVAFIYSAFDAFSVQD